MAARAALALSSAGLLLAGCSTPSTVSRGPENPPRPSLAPASTQPLDVHPPESAPDRTGFDEAPPAWYANPPGHPVYAGMGEAPDEALARRRAVEDARRQAAEFLGTDVSGIYEEVTRLEDGRVSEKVQSDLQSETRQFIQGGKPETFETVRVRKPVPGGGVEILTRVYVRYRIPEQDPAALWKHLADRVLQDGAEALALRLLHQAIRIDAQSIPTLLRIAELEVRLDKLDDAGVTLQRAESLSLGEAEQEQVRGIRWLLDSRREASRYEPIPIGDLLGSGEGGRDALEDLRSFRLLRGDGRAVLSGDLANPIWTAIEVQEGRVHPRAQGEGGRFDFEARSGVERYTLRRSQGGSHSFSVEVPFDPRGFEGTRGDLDGKSVLRVVLRGSRDSRVEGIYVLCPVDEETLFLLSEQKNRLALCPVCEGRFCPRWLTRHSGKYVNQWYWVPQGRNCGICGWPSH